MDGLFAMAEKLRAMSSGYGRDVLRSLGSFGRKALAIVQVKERRGRMGTFIEKEERERRSTEGRVCHMIELKAAEIVQCFLNYQIM